MDRSATHYTVLARRFRPAVFADVVGQQHISQALKNAIRNGRVAHAYLFTGVRGVGKTSMARILAKALNCPQVEDAVPCNACEICTGIAAGNDIDVQEIDGASNRGIDDIRALRANVNIKSMRTRDKIYIIDEVHMLTKEAFNALLKTLEEPPPNVKFIFCTTEPNKVPDTILSRCQRFDFLAIDTASIVSRLEQIVAAEGYEADAEALELIARRAGGSMRDSQSLLDQLLAFGNERFSVDDVHRMLGTASDDRLLSLIDAVLQRQQGRALAELDAALTGGVELGELSVQLLNYFRDLMIVAVGAAEVPFLAVSALCRPDLLRQAQSCGLPTVIAAQEILAETNRRMFRVRYGRSLLESALVRISLLEDLDQIRALLDSPDRNATGAGGGGGTGNQTPNKPVLPVHPKRSTNVSHPEHRNKNRDSTDSPQPSVDFQPGCEEELLSQLQKYADDATRSHLSAAQSLAISGPNQLDLLFPASYHFSRQYCERSGTRGLLEELAAKITGRPIRIAMQTIESDPVDATEASTAATSKPAHPDRNSLKKKAEQDPFVNDAVSVFEGTLRDARDVANSGPAET